MRCIVNGKVWIFCLVFIVLSNAAVFANGGADDAAREGRQAVTPEGVFPIVEERITITAFIGASGLVDDYEDNHFTRYLEDKTNIDIELLVAPGDLATQNQKRNLLLASGDYPEIFISSFSGSEYQFYGSQGVFLPLNDLIDKYGVNVRKALADYPEVKDNLTMPDGAIYAMPHVNDCFHCAYSQKMWVYRPWLEKLGLELPTTTAEFKDMLIAFRDRDPNGNGLKDEIPFSGATNSWNSGVDGFLMNSFIYSQDNLAGSGIRMFIENGKITAAFAQPAWREGLRYMNDLYNEGLLSGDAFTQDAHQLLQLGENPDTVLVGAVPAGWMGSFANVNGESGRWIEYTTLAPLEGPDGTRFAQYSPQYGIGYWTITDKAANPEAALRLGDVFYETELVLHNSYGQEGIGWAWAEPGEIGVNGRPAIWKALVDYGAGDRTAWWDQAGPQVRSRDFRLGEVGTGDGNSLSEILYQETRDKMEPYQADPQMIVPPLIFDEDVSVEIVDLESNLGTYVKEMIARFITGDADIETEWKGYLAELEKIGLPRYIKLVQEAYDKR